MSTFFICCSDIKPASTLSHQPVNSFHNCPRRTDAMLYMHWYGVRRYALAVMQEVQRADYAKPLSLRRRSRNIALDFSVRTWESWSAIGRTVGTANDDHNPRRKRQRYESHGLTLTTRLLVYIVSEMLHPTSYPKLSHRNDHCLIGLFRTES
jgi:hypothetical protein